MYDHKNKKPFDLRYIKVIPSFEEDSGKVAKAMNIEYPKEYVTESEVERQKYDYGIIEFAVDLERDFGYVGLDTRSEMEKKRKVKIIGYSVEKEKNEKKMY